MNSLMRVKFIFIFFLLLCFPLSACGSSSITITVLDSETKEPIEGAVAVVFWNQTKGVPGMTRTETVKIVEIVSNKDGKFAIPAVSVPIFADKPHLKVYKSGYVGWNNIEIYQGHYGDDTSTVKTSKRIGFKWRNQSIYLERFRSNYSYLSHRHFLSVPFPTSYKSGGEGLYKKATMYEIPFRQKEKSQSSKTRQGK